MEQVRLTLPYPPSWNHYLGQQGNKRFVTKQGKLYHQAVWAIVSQEGRPRFEDKTVAVCLEVHPPDNRRRDLDNALKVLLDSLKISGVYNDDSQIIGLVAIKMRPVLGGQVNVVISEAREVTAELWENFGK